MALHPFLSVPNRAVAAMCLCLILTICGVEVTPAFGQKQDRDLRQRERANGQAAPARIQYAKAHALIIGVGKQQSSRIPALRYPPADARDLKALLVESYGFNPANVTVLLDEQATRQNIQEELSGLANGNRVGPDDCVLIFFSGHGQTIALSGGGEMGFLVPFDAKVDLDDTRDRSGYLRTCLSMEQVWTYLDACDARHVLIAADACYSGLLATSRALPSTVALSFEAVAANLQRKARQVLTAGTGGEKAVERTDLGHGILTHKLLEELRARAAFSQTFAADSLASSIQTWVANYTGGKQNPQFGARNASDGRFLFTSVRPFRPNALPNTLAYRSSAEYLAAASAYRAGRYQEAASLFRPFADAGDALAQNNLGRMYYYGQGGLPKDPVEALKWLRKAAEQGNAAAQNSLGFMYERGEGGLPKDPVEAVRLYRKATEQDLAAAQTNLGEMYYNGAGGLPKDPVEALKWYRKAAQQGNAQAQTSLGLMYERGEGGLPKDLVEALKWLRKATEQDLAAAQYSLGAMYYNGAGGLPKDLVEAAKWFRKAAEQDFALAQFTLGGMYERGEGGLPKDLVEAAKWFRKAADAGDSNAKVALKRLGLSPN